jgi:nitric oxide synthase oxygenase domain/subunit
MFDALKRHIEYGGNNGNIRPAITVFRQRTHPDRDFRYKDLF